jgi:hypothetical protein
MNTKVIVDRSELKREVYQFYWIERDGVVLDEYAFETRESKRHKWKAHRVNIWSRLNSRKGEMNRPDVPEEVKEIALGQIRDKIQYCENR